MQRVVSLYGAGDLGGAEKLCRMLLEEEPGHFEALNLLGIIAARTRRTGEAADLLARAVPQQPRQRIQGARAQR
jgi:predicted Zn-dependent protease